MDLRYQYLGFLGDIIHHAFKRCMVFYVIGARKSRERLFFISENDSKNEYVIQNTRKNACAILFMRRHVTPVISGYHTINLEKEIFLPKNTRFAVIVSLDSAALGREYGFNEEGSGQESKPGQSFRFLYNEWHDTETSGNYMIKAYTCNASSEQVITATDIEFKNLDSDKLEMGVDETFKVNASVLPMECDRSIVWSSSDPAVAKVNKGQIIAVSNGVEKKTGDVVVDTDKLAGATSIMVTVEIVPGGDKSNYEGKTTLSQVYQVQ